MTFDNKVYDDVPFDDSVNQKKRVQNLLDSLNSYWFDTNLFRVYDILKIMYKELLFYDEDKLREIKKEVDGFYIKEKRKFDNGNNRVYSGEFVQKLETFEEYLRKVAHKEKMI